MPFRVFADANILVRARWRDIVLSLAEAGTCRVLWSDGVLDEVRRHLPEGMSPADRTALLDTMNAVFPEARVAWPGAVE